MEWWKSHQILFYFPSRLSQYLSVTRGRTQEKRRKNCKNCVVENLAKIFEQQYHRFRRRLAWVGGRTRRTEYAYLLMARFSFHNCLFLYSAQQRFLKSHRKYSEILFDKFNDCLFGGGDVWIAFAVKSRECFRERKIKLESLFARVEIEFSEYRCD